MNKKYVMALDAGTTSNRCILFDVKGNMVSVAQKEFTQYFPEAGWVEHDAKEIWESMLEVSEKALADAGAVADDIAGIGITNQRETSIIWNKETGEPVYNAIVWQCRRTARFCDSLKEKGLTEKYRQKTGLVIDAYFSATKIKWILDNVEGARRMAEDGKLLFGTVETWLIWNLTGGKVHATDYSNASRTMLFNINTLEWDEEILEELDIPKLLRKRTTDYDLLTVRMPRLKFKTNIELDEVLRKLGVTEIFEKKADFSGISDDPLYIDRMLQKTKLELDEHGTRASAVTIAMAFGGCAFRPPRRILSVELNRPFAFLIYDPEEKQVLFMGKVNDPTVKE